MFNITLEHKDSLKVIQRKFDAELSVEEIQRTTARALNDIGKNAMGFIKKQVRQEYTMKAKYLARMAQITHYASGNSGALYTSISFNYRPVPLVAFKFTGGKKGKKTSSISVEVRKGQSIAMRHAFIARMKNVSNKGEESEHQGIYAAGRYVGKEFVFDNSKTASGKQRITELRSASPFTASISNVLKPKITTYISHALPAKLEYFLQRKLDKMKSK